MRPGFLAPHLYMVAQDAGFIAPDSLNPLRLEGHYVLTGGVRTNIQNTLFAVFRGVRRLMKCCKARLEALKVNPGKFRNWKDPKRWPPALGLLIVKTR